MMDRYNRAVQEILDENFMAGQIIGLGIGFALGVSVASILYFFGG